MLMVLSALYFRYSGFIILICRPILAKYEAYNGKNYGARMSWEELFESRMFSSRIIKSTIDNPGDNFISAYIKDPILGLLEGDDIKEKIFNYEQDLWSILSISRSLTIIN